MEFIIEHDDLISILVSILCGSIIGFEREYNNKSAGFRTIILISLGSTIFTIVSNHGIAGDDRIAANIITGIGFIGAGVIFKDKLTVMGLTTAAVIWTTAGIGMATGMGYHFLALCLTIFTVIVLSLFEKIEYFINKLRHTRIISVTFRDADINNIIIIEKYIVDSKMKSKRTMMNKSRGQLFASFKVSGNEKQFALLNEELVKTDSIIEFY